MINQNRNWLSQRVQKIVREKWNFKITSIQTLEKWLRRQDDHQDDQNSLCLALKSAFTPHYGCWRHRVCVCCHNEVAKPVMLVLCSDQTLWKVTDYASVTWLVHRASIALDEAWPRGDRAWVAIAFAVASPTLNWLHQLMRQRDLNTANVRKINDLPPS